MIAVHKRSKMRHLVHPDGIATRCGRILHRTRWQKTHARICDCRVCLKNAMASSR